MSKQKLKHQIEEIFLELNLQDLPLTTTFESSVDDRTGALQPEISQQAIQKTNPVERTESQPGVDENTLIEINKTIDLIPYILNSFSQINGLSNLLIQGIDGALKEQQLSDVTSIRRISEAQSFLLKEIEELSRRSRGNDAKKNTAFSVQDLLTQIQTVFLKGEYRGVISLEVNCPSKIPNLFTDSVFLRRSIIHSLELMVLFDKEIVIAVESAITDQNSQTLHFFIHPQTSVSLKGKPPSVATQKSARLHQFFIKHWIDQIEGQVLFEQDTNHRFSNIHIQVPVIEDPNIPGGQKSGVEKQTVLLIGQTIPSELKEAASQLDWTLIQIKNKKEMDKLGQSHIHTCFINLADYEATWQEINDCLYEISASDTPIVPIFHDPKEQISAWFPQARMMINPIEPGEMSSLIHRLANQQHLDKIFILDNKHYIAKSLKILEKQFDIQSINQTMDNIKNFSNSTMVVINLPLSSNGETIEETHCLQECFSKKIPLIFLLPENVDQEKAGIFQNALKSMAAEENRINIDQVINFFS